MPNKTIYVFGNENFREDSLPLRLIPWLEKEFEGISFRILDPTENFPEEEHLIVIDTAVNTGEVRAITDGEIEKIQQPPNYSVHDFDLGIQLKIMKKLGKIKRATIICVPPPSKINMENAFDGLKKILMGFS